MQITMQLVITLNDIPLVSRNIIEIEDTAFFVNHLRAKVEGMVFSIIDQVGSTHRLPPIAQRQYDEWGP